MMRCLVARALIVTMCSTCVPRAEGAVIGTDATINGDRERIFALLERPEVAAQLEAFGVRMSDAKARIAALTDAEAAQISAEIDKAYAGAGENPIIYLMMAPLVVLLLPFFLLGAMAYNVITYKKSDASMPYDASRVHKP